MRDLLPYLLPVAALQLALQAWAVVDLVRRERVRGGKGLWAAVVLLGGLIGPALYFLLSREE